MPHLPRTARRVAAAAALLLASLTLGVSGPAQAADNGAWSVTPTPPEKASVTPRNYFILEGAPGTVIKDKLRVQNWTQKPMSFHIYGADGYNTAQDGFFALRDFKEKQQDLGAWVDPVTSQVTVYGRTQVDIPITIRIPKNATPGDHVGGVVAMNVNVEATDKDNAIDVGIQRAVAARTYVRVTGTTSPGLEVTNATFEHDRGALPWTGKGSGTVSWTVENTGNLRLSPEGEVKLSGLGTRDATTETAPLVDLLPGQKVTITQKVSGIPWFGVVDAEVRLSAGDDLTDTARTSDWIVPWPFFVVLAVVVVALAFWLKRRAGVMRRKLREAEDAPKISVASEPVSS